MPILRGQKSAEEYTLSTVNCNFTIRMRTKSFLELYEVVRCELIQTRTLDHGS